MQVFYICDQLSFLVSVFHLPLDVLLCTRAVKSGANVFDLKHAYIYGGIVLGLIVALAVPAMVYSLCRNRDTRKSEPQQLGQLIKMPSAMSCAAR